MIPTVVARRVGREAEPVVVVDDFHPEPSLLSAAARRTVFARADKHYPGVRAALTPETLLPVSATIAAVLAEVFGKPRSAHILDIGFSIVTASPESLSLVQRLPHVDAIAEERIAMVLFLTNEPDGGTAFFRHRTTGYETLNAERAPGYFAMLQDQVAATPPPDAYPSDSLLFERTYSVAARYNRAVLYRSRMFHSGIITSGTPLIADAARGRLTITAFLSAT